MTKASSRLLIQEIAIKPVEQWAFCVVIRSRRVAAHLPIAHHLLTLTYPSLLIGNAPVKQQCIQEYFLISLFITSFLLHRWYHYTTQIQPRQPRHQEPPLNISKPRDNLMWRIYIDAYRGVEKFKYQCCVINDTNRRGEEIESRLQGLLVSKVMR